MNRTSPLWHWGDGPEYEKPEETPEEKIESQVDRMRRLNKAFAEDHQHLLWALYGGKK